MTKQEQLEEDIISFLINRSGSYEGPKRQTLWHITRAIFGPKMTKNDYKDVSKAIMNLEADGMIHVNRDCAPYPYQSNGINRVTINHQIFKI